MSLNSLAFIFTNQNQISKNQIFLANLSFLQRPIKHYYEVQLNDDALEVDHQLGLLEKLDARSHSLLRKDI